MTTHTRLDTTPATSDWKDLAACQGQDTEMFFVEQAETQEQIKIVCRGCPVLVQCLGDILTYEDSTYAWGVVGGLTVSQRRALRCEGLLGRRLNVRQARALASPQWASVLSPMRQAELVPSEVVAGLRPHGVIASEATARLALWWTGGSGNVLAPRVVGDRRQLWQRVRDEAQEVVGALREQRVCNRDIAAYLQVGTDALERASTAWRRAAEGVAA
ncbi:WhiB family transcriptional regulator [Streptomyces cellulosae]